MEQRSTQDRIRRLLRKRRKQAERLGAHAEDQFERNLVRRFGRLYLVRRFVIVWVLLVVLLIGGVVVQTRSLAGYYQTLQPAPGGMYHEGIIGSYTNSNPLYVAGQVNDAVSKLLYAGLFTYDAHNKLTGDLAESYTVDPAETSYTVKLRPNLTWHDGRPLTADDVVFTYKTIQSPDAQSPLFASWQGVQVSASDARTVVFRLPNPLSSFPYSLTTGIIPQHAFGGSKTTNFRSLPFNTIKPIGAGPYKFKDIEVSGNSPSTRREEIQLVPFDGYHGGAPAISSFIVHTYPSGEQMTEAFKKHDITAMVGLQDVPEGLDDNTQVTVMPLAAVNMVFFKTTSGVLTDKTVRQAMVGSVDVGKLTSGLRQPVLPVREPLLPTTAGYDPSVRQLDFGVAKANELLDSAGWKRRDDGVRVKDGKPLSFKLYAQRAPEYERLTRGLQNQWRQIGADVQVFQQADADLRSTVADHSYDALLYGISLGVDPDGFVYWHSSQADVRSASRLNLSEYKSAVADAALEAGRTRSDPSLRAVKYKPFLEAWRDDAPALGLYQSRFLYITRGTVANLPDHTLTTDTDRFNNVSEWMIRRVAKTQE